MASVTVDLTANQVIGAKDHFGTQNNTEAVALFRAWVSSHADQWYADSLKDEIAAIGVALAANPDLIAGIMTELGL